MFVFNCSLNSNDKEDISEKSSEALLFNSFKELSKAVLRSSEVLILQLDQRFNLFVSGERFFIFQRFSSSFDLSWSLLKYRLLVDECGKL